MKGKPWDDRMELFVPFEINTPTGFRYRRPYVAVWIEDKQGASVRTLALWIQGGRGVRWLRHLSEWYQDEQTRQAAQGGDLTNTSSATRQPGKYSVVWNGRDDQNKPVQQGEWTLCIETAREHGPHTILRKALTLESRPLKVDLGSNEEIKSAAVEYRRRTS